ncbi:MAG TPA: MmgE/PrpD family protein [Candidatus Acidoferrales bacterium]|nr:MmgE/PrpD family protein [Candidatus Acidoferrales bacterium]
MALADQFALGVEELSRQPLPPPVRHEAERTLLNTIATAVCSSGHPAVDQVLRVSESVGGLPFAPIPGRIDNADLHFAAICTGLAAHLDDFDDTHLASGNVHAGSVALAATLGMAMQRRSTGSQFLTAFALACETVLRVAMAIAPAHHEEGWQPSSTCGPIGGAVGAGLVLGLDQTQLASAMGLGAVQLLGHREAFGTPTKAFHPGKSAANGILAATLAASGFTAPRGLFEDPVGFCAVLARENSPDRLVAGLGREWELLQNTYKPYPCGVVCHPGIDAAIELSGSLSDPSRVTQVLYDCHPILLELVDRPDPSGELEARFSAQHGVAVGLVDGSAGLSQYSDERVRSEDVRRVRARIELRPKPEFGREEAALEVVMEDGSRLRAHVVNAKGGLARPLSDAELFSKLDDLCRVALPGAAGRIAASVAALEQAGDLHDLVSAIVPAPAPEPT